MTGVCDVFNLSPLSDPHSGESGIDEEYERVVIMKYEKELEAKFGKFERVSSCTTRRSWRPSLVSTTGSSL